MADEKSNPALDAFLMAGHPAAEATPPAPSPPPQPQATEPEPKSEQPKPAKTVERPASPPPSEAEDDDDLDDGSGTVSHAAFRRARADYKTKAARAEGELAELRRQLEAARTPQPAAPPAEQRAQRQPPPDPATNPAGYHAWFQSERINDKLDMSEAMLRSQVGDEQVDAMQKEFRAAAEADPTLWGKLYAQPHPYAWAHKQIQQMRVVREVGTDPDAYRNKLRAEIEAEVRAQLGQGVGGPAEPQAPPRSPVANLPPSLANVRSSAPRGEAFAGPPAIDDIVGRRSGDIFARQR